MALQEPGRNRFVYILFLVLLGCCNTVCKEKNEYYNTDHVTISTKGGISKINNVPVSGFVYTLSKNGDTLYSMPYKNGREHGILKEFYNNGSIKTIRVYKNGWKQDEHLGWYENGNKKFEFHFKNDMFEGNQKEWLENGNPFSNLNYEKGIESGRQTVWYANGKIKTNYIIKDGRHYGLLGTKNCVNISDSVFNRYK